jgi:hypothetical protein
MTEIASDTKIFNSASVQFHLNIGFSELKRIFCSLLRIGYK